MSNCAFPVLTIPGFGLPSIPSFGLPTLNLPGLYCPLD